jgi:drug/metabolite transporter (DMT)-like permease
LNLNLIKFRIADLGSVAIAAISVVLVAPLAVIYLFGFTDFTDRMAADAGAWQAFGYIFVLALMSTAVANSIFNKLVKLTTPLFASTVTYIIPIVSVAWGVLDDESVYVTHFIGMAAILSGVYLANRKWE